MNTAIHFLKAHSLKATLPLLLLVTACGEGTPSAQQSDEAPSAAESVMAAAKPANYFGMPDANGAPLEAPEVKLPEAEEENDSFDKVLPPSGTEGNDTPTEGAKAGVEAGAVAESVPEPAALAGLAIAAAGMVTIKRKQSA